MSLEYCSINKDNIDINENVKFSSIRITWEITMKRMITLLLVTFTLTACAPKIGSEEWCAELKEKPKGDWTATEAKDYTKHCIF